MSDTDWISERARRGIARLLPRVRSTFNDDADSDPAAWRAFEARLTREWERLFGLLIQLYGSEYDFFYHLEQILALAARSWFARPQSLRDLDARREADPGWFHSQRMVGAVLYVDLFAGNLAGVREHLPYLKQLGITYLHLMPLFDAPAGNNDGGYAVSSYRTVSPSLGTMRELSDLAATLRADGVSLVVDFVFNHTSDEHEWARRARAGERDYEDFYLIYPDRSIPDQYDATLREIFPTVRRGNFTWDEGMHRWIWTTFNSFQWDLNYRNPEVFRAMASEMLFLANSGVEVLRLDAVAFIWKRLGTTCENLPEAHLVIQAYNALARVAAPALLFKSEAIVHPDEVVKYIGMGESQLSYNPLLMSLCWEALATREVKLLSHSLRTRWKIADGCAWVNYLRCHDDIGWTFDDEDARLVGVDPYGHRRFLNAFYTGEFPGSFARGVPFQSNPETGDSRVSGTLASLAGLEQGVQEHNSILIDLAIRRILLLHSVILSVGGIPLIYIGDEVATLNDYGYVNVPAKADDSRWVHRVPFQWEGAGWNDMARPEGYVYNELLRLIALRKGQPALAGGDLSVIDTGSPHLLGYIRQHEGQRLLLVANFSEYPQSLSANRLRLYGMGYRFTDLNTGVSVSAGEVLPLSPYQFVWLEAQG
ncbi:alpha-glucosidase C-terminal domain-containing protein [Oscillochloris sp. ZM17-4]|uniref:alpha-amylase family glycosyl hydrolase n=1 Tax=Oscillochloris sp. ZM17-4 TaxID=2866714 RepID=UPI001C72BB92|nr:alpha-amylase family glycosyl hydrolase [Oscillochloris sp. ZM17-4]MBX0329259.1 alpha-glucosidase C-terminal domain-containing protein [Oscillochloris sp. ZM17-4]